MLLAEIAQGEPLALGAAVQPSGKTVHVWAVRADLDPTQIRSNTFEIEWPPKSGRKQEFPEVDRAAWFPLAAAEGKILEGQRVFLSRLAAALGEEAAAVGDEPGPSGRRRP